MSGILSLWVGLLIIVVFCLLLEREFDAASLYFGWWLVRYSGL